MILIREAMGIDFAVFRHPVTNGGDSDEMSCTEYYGLHDRSGNVCDELTSHDTGTVILYRFFFTVMSSRNVSPKSNAIHSLPP